MNSTINGYRLLSPLHNDNSGNGRWGFAEKDGFELFLKEFISPVYPIDERIFSEAQLAQKRELCDRFVKRKIAFYTELKKCRSGNIVVILDFFRWGSKYYVVTEKIDNTTILPEAVFEMAFGDKLLLAKVICHCFSELHQHHIVHGDVKPANILIKQTVKGAYTAKIIDFDSSFFHGESMDCDDEIQGDLVYLAPETFLRMAGRSNAMLTAKIDIFALGVLFYQYFIGGVPSFADDYDYTFEAMLNDAPLSFPAGTDPGIVALLSLMLKKNPGERGDINEVLRSLNEIGMNDIKSSNTQKRSFFRKGKKWL